jgi:hypothetical protein
MSTPDLSAEPYSDEDEALAESLVAQVMEKYRGVLPADVFTDLSETMVDELLATPEGRDKLWAFKGDSAKVVKSADLEIHPTIAEARRKARGEE